jgi:hypothetical protein
MVKGELLSIPLGVVGVVVYQGDGCNLEHNVILKSKSIEKMLTAVVYSAFLTIARPIYLSLPPTLCVFSSQNSK